MQTFSEIVIQYIIFEKENTTMLSGKLGMNNYGISYKKQTSKFENDLKNISHDRNIKEEEIFKDPNEKIDIPDLAISTEE